MPILPDHFFSEDEWEALCDGCGICCLYKIVDPDSGEIFFTSLVCPMLNPQLCRCKAYASRFDLGLGCVKLEAKNLTEIKDCLPKHCAYRRISEGLSLPSWHPVFRENTPVSQSLLLKLNTLGLKPAGHDPDLAVIQDIMSSAKAPDPHRKLNKQLVKNVLENADL